MAVKLKNGLFYTRIRSEGEREEVPTSNSILKEIDHST
jgi:hypothetical protein